jgi:hypothetical protein
MWIMLNSAFLSIVNKNCPPGALLVRARREGDIERTFGADLKVQRLTDADYLWHAVVPVEVIAARLVEELTTLNYGNFKSSVKDHELHDAYLGVWHVMARLQDPPPYSERHHPGFYTDSRIWEQPKDTGQPEKRVTGRAQPAGKPSKGRRP